MTQLSLQQVLSELKLTNEKLDKLLRGLEMKSSTPVVFVSQKGNFPAGYKTEAEYLAYCQGVHDQFVGLFDYYCRLKRAQLIANVMRTPLAEGIPLQEITIAGKTMLLAEAIERRRFSGDYWNRYLTIVAEQISRTNSMHTRMVEQVEAEFSAFATGSKQQQPTEGTIPSNLLEFRDTWMEARRPVYLDPYNYRSKLPKWQDEVADFASKVNDAITTANVAIFVEV